ncbi:MAG: endonuclease/exonuclease/phosphatase family protein [Pyrinomonadaceae bacterium]
MKPKIFLTLALVMLLMVDSGISRAPATTFESDPDLSLLETGQATKVRNGAPVPSELKIVSYNIRWRGGEDLKKLIQVLQTDSELGQAAILGLQEVDRQKKRTENANTVKLLAEELGMHYAWTAPPTPRAEKEEETGVAILSPYPLAEVKRIVLPHEGAGRRRRVAIGATAVIGDTRIRFYSVHLETRMSVKKKLEQMQAVLADLEHFPRKMPAIVVGDLNTWEPQAVNKTEKLFKAQGFKTPFDNDSTFFRRLLFVPLKLKLDWMWLRNLEVTKFGIDKTVKLSDHWPLWMNVTIQKAKPQ